MKISDDKDVQAACKHLRVDRGWSLTGIAEAAGVGMEVVKEALVAAGVDPNENPKLALAREWARRVNEEAKTWKEMA